MPTLDWIGKAAVQHHHRAVPVRLLEPVPALSCGAADAGNLIVQGDNLHALKALLPRYAGQVKCIYIDPPYNTGNEGWVYNDNVNSPEIRRWLGEVVGKEGETLDRHDRWLCMMYPRLVLLREFLSDDGVIFISIDDNEVAALRLVMDEIFGIPCFVAKITWENNHSPRNDAKGIPYVTDNIIIYSKQPNWQPSRLPRTTEMDSRYGNPDGDPHPWTSAPAHAPSAKTHKSMVYAIQHPMTGELMYPPPNRCWCREQSSILEIMREWANYELRYIDDASTRASICGVAADEKLPNVPAIMISGEIDDAKLIAQKRYAQGNWPDFYFTKNGAGGMRVKKRLSGMQGKVVTSLWSAEEVGTTTIANAEIKHLFNGEVPFDTPKPTRLIQRILQIATDKDSLVLDSFAGSGTTAHAVLKQNAADGGSRRFILVEMDANIACTVTAERVRRAAQGYTNPKGEAVAGLGGGFQFCRLSKEPLFSADGQVRADVTFAQLAEFVWFKETGTGFTGQADSPLLGVHEGRAIYLLYNGILKDRSDAGGNVLTDAVLAALPPSTGSRVIYAAACRLSPARLAQHGIVFKQTPYELQPQ